VALLFAPPSLVYFAVVLVLVAALFYYIPRFGSRLGFGLGLGSGLGLYYIQRSGSKYALLRW
jgi:hypothetical protein